MYTFEQGPRICVTLEFEEQKLKRTHLEIAKQFEARFEGEPEESLTAELLRFLKSYSEKRHADVQLLWDGLTPFRKEVLERLQRVKFGTTVSYGELALNSGYPRAARAVGSACHHNPFPLLVPCHRVIAASGKIGGFAYHLTLKEILLDFEASYLEK